MFQISWKRKGPICQGRQEGMVPEGRLGSSARTFSSAGCVVASGTNYELGDPPPFPSRSHDVASERAGVSELRRTPAKPSRRSKLPVANPIRPIGWARFRGWQKIHPFAVVQHRCSVVLPAASSFTSSCLAWGLEWDCGELWTPIAEPRVERRAGVGLQFRGPSWP